MTGFKPGDRVQPAAHCQDIWPASAGTVVAPESSPVRVAWDNAAMITIHPPTNLEPLGEPMSTTFKSTMTDRTLTVGVHHDSPHIAIESTATAADGFFYAVADAPALALAILEAAGIESADTDFDKQIFGGPEKGAEYAVMWLRNLAEHQTAKAKEVEDREALEAEALDLCNMMFAQKRTSWDELSSEAKNSWTIVARRARELHGVTA